MSKKTKHAAHRAKMAARPSTFGASSPVARQPSGAATSAGRATSVAAKPAISEEPKTGITNGATSAKPMTTASGASPTQPPAASVAAPLQADLADPASQVAVPPKVLAIWGIALLQAIPFMLVAYDLFLIIVSLGAVAALVAGAALIALIPLLWYFVPRWRPLLAWMGRVEYMNASLITLGFGLYAWSMWSVLGRAFFSSLSILALVAALLLLIVAQHQRDVSTT